MGTPVHTLLLATHLHGDSCSHPAPSQPPPSPRTTSTRMSCNGAFYLVTCCTVASCSMISCNWTSYTGMTSARTSNKRTDVTVTSYSGTACTWMSFTETLCARKSCSETSCSGHPALEFYQHWDYCTMPGHCKRTPPPLPP
jgi:hypothetical protein